MKKPDEDQGKAQPSIGGKLCAPWRLAGSLRQVVAHVGGRKGDAYHGSVRLHGLAARAAGHAVCRLPRRLRPGTISRCPKRPGSPDATGAVRGNCRAGGERSRFVHGAALPSRGRRCAGRDSNSDSHHVRRRPVARRTAKSASRLCKRTSQRSLCPVAGSTGVMAAGHSRRRRLHQP